MPDKYKNEKKLHGNMAKLDPQGHVESLFSMNTVTNSAEKDHETPIISADSASYARKFVEENKK